MTDRKYIIASMFILLSLAALALRPWSFAENQGQMDTLSDSRDTAKKIPEGLSFRTRIVRADKAPVKIEVQFRRGLYWKRAGTLGTITPGEWTAWADCSKEFFQGKGASDFVIIEFPGVRDFEAEYQLSFQGKVLKTILEKGAVEFSTIVIPKWLLEKGKSPLDEDFIRGFTSLTEFTSKRLSMFKERFGVTPAPATRYSFEADYQGYVDAESDNKQRNYFGRQSSLENLRLEMILLQYLGYNGFVGEEGYKFAQKSGMGASFRNILSINRAQAPWYKIACPFDPVLEARKQEMIADIRKRAASLGEINNFWVKWGDEIGVIAKAEHLSSCPVCARHFRDYLQEHKLAAKDFGKDSWDDIRPFSGWKAGRPDSGSWPVESPEDALNLYYSMKFMGWATGHFYEPASRQLKALGIHIGPLQGPTPTWDGHSIDYFEFYRATPSSSIIWETSNRDPRVFQWDGYLADITRAISKEHGVPVHVYIKPHRGAPTQRLLSLAARGIKSFNWYNYGPPYLQGDEYTAPKNTDLMLEVASASRLLASAEDVLYDAKRVPEYSSVALLYPRTSFNLTRGFDSTNHFQDAKWVWTALKHNHVTVDLIDEEMINQGILKHCKVLYVVGSHIREDAARHILEWVKQGGILWTDLAGFSRNERNTASPSGIELTGQSKRFAEVWGTDPGYKATELGRLLPRKGLQAYKAPDNALISLKSPLQGSFPASVAREELDASGAEILARFGDSKPAAIRRTLGKGRVYVIGTFAGLSYSDRVRRNDFDMSADFDPVIRSLISIAISEGTEGRRSRPVTANNPLVEASLSRNGRNAIIILSNWGFRRNSNAEAPSLIDGKEIVLEIHVISSWSTVESASGSRVAANKTPQGLKLNLDRLGPGDILIIKDAVFTESDER